MQIRFPIVSALAALLSLGAANGVAAQQDDSVYLSMRNTIGLLRYCQAQGFLDAAIAEAKSANIKTVIASLPAPANPAEGDEREKAGEAGKWGSRQTDAAEHAKMFDMTLEAQCQEWAM